MKRGLIIGLFCLIFISLIEVISAGSCADSDTIMKLYSESNSHGALYNDVDYPYDICYSDIFGSAGIGNRDCSGNKVIGLSSTSNAHAQKPELITYFVNVCYDDLECIYVEAGDCSGDYECVITLYSEDNSHLADCNSAQSYPNKICCSSGGCVDECTLSGLRECHLTEESYRECGNYDADSCLEWSEYTSCTGAEICQAGVCSLCTCPELAECGMDSCGNPIGCGDCDVLYPGEDRICDAAQQCALTGNAYWADLNGEKIGDGTSRIHSEIDDTVLLIYKDMGDYAGDYDFVISEEDWFINPNDLIRTIPASETFNYNGHLAAKWIINQSEFDKGADIFELENELEFFFMVNAEQSNNLNVNNTSETPSDSPTVIIKEPIINSKVRVGNVIEFNQTAKDEDDDLKIKWIFEDGDESDWMFNCLTTGNCNTTHAYGTSGTKIIEIVAREMTRTNEAVNNSKVFAYDEGINVFAVITEPPFGKIYAGDRAQLIPFNASGSYVANCTLVSCTAGETCLDIIDDLYCYNLDKTDIPSEYDLFFDWSFSEGVGRFGDWSVDYAEVVEFDRLFIAPTAHWAKLRVDYNSVGI